MVDLRPTQGLRDFHILLVFQDRGLSKIFGDLSALHSKDSDEGENFAMQRKHRDFLPAFWMESTRVDVIVMIVTKLGYHLTYLGILQPAYIGVKIFTY